MMSEHVVTISDNEALAASGYCADRSDNLTTAPPIAPDQALIVATS